MKSMLLVTEMSVQPGHLGHRGDFQERITVDQGQITEHAKSGMGKVVTIMVRGVPKRVPLEVKMGRLIFLRIMHPAMGEIETAMEMGTKALIRTLINTTMISQGIGKEEIKEAIGHRRES